MLLVNTAPFLFIIVIYVLKRSAGDFGYITHKRNTQDNNGRAVRITTCSTDNEVYGLAFADDIALLKNDSKHAKRKLRSLKTEAGKVGLEINVQNNEKMLLDKPANLSTVDHIVINDQPINIVDDFKYLGSYVGSTEHDVKVRIGLAWAAFAKLKSISKWPIVTVPTCINQIPLEMVEKYSTISKI